MSVLHDRGGSPRVKVGVGLATAALGMMAWAAVQERGFDGGRRLSAQQWISGADYVTGETEAPGAPTCKTLMRLFKTVAASPQAALHRMSSTGKPNLQEWTDAIQDWNWGLSRSQISSMFHGIDSAMDGQVDIHELLACFRRGEYEGQFWQSAKAPSPPVASFQPQALPAQAASKYDCYDGLDMWRFEWSKEKTLSCSLISASELRGSLSPDLTPAQVVKQMDTNMDGVVSHDEWLAAATGFSGHGPFLKSLTEPRAEFAFKSIDVSQDGNLNEMDLANSLGLQDASLQLGAAPPTSAGVSVDTLKTRVLGRWSTLSNAFQKMDRDDNHRLSRDEFSTGLEELRPPIEDKEEMARLFEGFDALNDGRITPPEWHGTLQSGQLFQSPEALQKVLHMGAADSSSWIHRSPPQTDSLRGAEQTTDRSKLSGNLQTLSAHAEGKFREKAVQWAGSMRSACSKMGVLHGDISLSAFQAAIGAFEPLLGGETAGALFNKIDEDHNGFISSQECFLSQQELREQLSSVKSLRNLFCDADFNNDGQLSRDEFGKLGKLLNKGSSAERYSAYFDELAGTGQPPLTLAALETLAGRSDFSQHVLSKEESSKYNVPAIVHGKCILSVTGDSVPPGLSEKVGKAFSATLSQQLGVTVRVAGAQEQRGTTSKEFDVLYTSKTQDGAVVMQKLHENAGSIQSELEEAVAAMISTSASTTAWCKSTLDFYGPEAGKLPKGQKVTQEFGQLAGQAKESAVPYITGH